MRCHELRNSEAPSRPAGAGCRPASRCVSRSHGCVVAEDRRAIGTHVDLAAEPAVRLLRSHTVLNLRLSQTVPRGSRGKQRGIGVTVGRPVGCGNKTTKKRAVTGSVRLPLRPTERFKFRPTKHGFPDYSQHRGEDGGALSAAHPGAKSDFPTQNKRVPNCQSNPRPA